MPVYADEIQTYSTTLRYKRWCHLFADSDEELHALAAQIGLKRSWHQNKPGFSHYDLTPSKHAQALRCGALALSMREMVQKVQERRGEAVEDQVGRKVALMRGEGCLVTCIEKEDVGASFPAGTRYFCVQSQHKDCAHDLKCQWIDLVYSYNGRYVVVLMRDLDHVSVGSVIRRLTEM